MGLSRTVFQCEVPEDLICGICEDVVEDLVMLQTCEHIFCRECVHIELDLDRCCPKDQIPFTESSVRKPYTFIQSVYDTLSISCRFSPECDEVVKISQFENHLRDCSFNPLNQRVCDNCSSKLTIATTNSHNCVDFFRSTIAELETENRRLKAIKEKLLLEQESLESTVIEDVPEDAKTWVITPVTVRQKLRMMFKKLRSIKQPPYINDSWKDSQFLRSFLPLAGNVIVGQIFLETDLSKLIYIQSFMTGGFDFVLFTRNTIFLAHVLMFQLIQPLLNDHSNVLVLDYIENGISQWIAQIAQNVTTAVNPELIDDYRQMNFDSPFADKICYVKNARGINNLAKEISYDAKKYPIIVGCHYLFRSEIEELMKMVCPPEGGIFLAYDRSDSSLSLYTLSTDSLGRRKITFEKLLQKHDLIFRKY